MYECVYICVYIYICDLTFGQFHFVFKGQPFQRNISNSISLFRTISLNRPHLKKQKKNLGSQLFHNYNVIDYKW